jgi:hypothetical protein
MQIRRKAQETCVKDPDPSGHQAKIERKTLIPAVLLLLFDFLSLKNDVNVPSKSNKQKNLFFILVSVGVLKVKGDNSRIRIRIRESEAWIRGSGSVPNLMDPQHWYIL